MSIWQIQIFYIFDFYFFLNIYVSLVLHVWQSNVGIFLHMPIKILLQLINISHLAAIFFLM